ncbi:MAG: hypothetical protein H6807_14835 [Planctomycetes bacterium]|nr:hypothetical protein [Planctomycetota bacterium]
MIVERPADPFRGFEPAQVALLERLVGALEGRSESFALSRCGAGLEIRKAALAERPAGRPRILVFAATSERLVAFFYKPSRLSFSRDRFSYGAINLHPARAEDALLAFAEGLDYLEADFRPAAKPARLKRSLDVTVPEPD